MVQDSLKNLRAYSRGFLQTLVGGIATVAAVREFPFKVFSFPTDLRKLDFQVKNYSVDIPITIEEITGNRILTVNEITKECLDLLNKSILDTMNQTTMYGHGYLKLPKIGEVLHVRTPQRFANQDKGPGYKFKEGLNWLTT